MNHNRRLALFVCFVIIALSFVLTNSSSNAQGGYPAPLSADQNVKIVLYNYNLASAGIGAEGTKQLIAEFEAKFPNITIEGVGVASPDIIARTQADFAAGNPPDTAQLVFSDLDFIVNNFPVKPLETIVPPDELKAHFAGMSAKGLELGRLKGKTYGLAYTFSTPVLFYNADIFKAAGLDPEKPPTTWAEIKNAAQAIKSKTGNDGIVVAALGQFDWMFQGMVRSNGGRVLSEDRKTLTFAQPEGVEVVRMWQDLVASGVHPKFGAEALTAFSGGKLGMFLQTSAVQSTLIAATKGKFELRAGAMPAFGSKPTKPTNSGSAMFIFSNDPLKQRAAWEYVKFVTSERGYTIITSKIGYLPLRPGIVDDPEYLKAWVEANPLVRPNLKQLENLEPWISFPGPNYQQIVGIMMKAVEEAIYATGDVEAILKAAQERAQQLMPK